MAYRWAPPPPLPERHRQALAEALASLEARTDLTAVLLAGSVVEGTAGPTSDIDLFCLIEGDARQRRHLVASTGVLVEMFLNPPQQVRRYLADERRRNRPSTAHMLATGRVLLGGGRPEALAALRREAADLLRAGPDPLTGADRERAIYVVRDAFEDAVDAEALGAPALVLPLAQCALQALSLHYALHRRWEPKRKNVATDLGAWDPDGARTLAGFAARPDIDTLRALVQHVLAAEGGLAIRSFDGPVEPLAPDGHDCGGRGGSGR